jgi:murein DD-endopeptidase MepM/ murein hydrolase activator NlpD
MIKVTLIIIFSSFVLFGCTQKSAQIEFNHNLGCDSTKKSHIRRDKKITRANPMQSIPISNGKIVGYFGGKTAKGVNSGIDIKGAIGQPVKSLSSGRVVFNCFNQDFGNTVIVKMQDRNILVAYGNLGSIKVKKFSDVKRGDILGHLSSKALHIAVKSSGISVDPIAALSVLK